MKTVVIAAAVSLLFVFLLPLALINSEPLLSGEMERQEINPAEKETTEMETTEAQLPEKTPYASDAETTVRLFDQGEVLELKLDKYLWGVTAAEMPAAFEEEALKAQVVAARTYALRKIAAGPTDRHPQADLCSDSGCCQAYCTREKMEQKWGEQAEAYAAKISEAVAATDGQVLLYEGELIQALYHSSSGGYTKDAAEVWGSDIPYLRSVVSPEDCASVPEYYSIQRIPAKEFREKFLSVYPAADLGAKPEDWFQNLTRSSTGSVTTVDIGGISVKGTEVRTLLGLRSAAFVPEVKGDDIVCSVIGYGHGVGMSQYGANVLAQSGMNFVEILSWYYKETTVSDYAFG